MRAFLRQSAPLLALLLAAAATRYYYVFSAVVPFPASGDAAEFYQLAKNLLALQTFGLDGADAFRAPGYPAFLAAVMLTSGDGWYTATLWLQATMGVVSVALTYLLARNFLPSWAALSAGWLCALFPPMVFVSGYLVSETLYCLLLLGSIVLLNEGRAKTAGLVGSLAYLVNPVCLPALVVYATVRRTTMIPFLICLALAPAAWTARNALHGVSGMNRATVNFVQGSQPDYHDAHMAMMARGDRARFDQIMADAAAPDSVARTLSRLVADPARSIMWYGSKPWLLWQWRMRLVQSDVSIYFTQQSPFTGALLPLVSLAIAITPLLGLLMLGGVFDRRAWPVMAFLIVVTGVHVVLQAEPRYAIPYRPFQFVAALTCVSWLAGKWRREKGGNLPATPG